MDERDVLVPRADVAQREYVRRGFVQPVDRGGRDAVAAEYLAERLAAADFGALGTVVVGIDAVQDVLRLVGGLLFRGGGILRAGSRGERESAKCQVCDTFHSYWQRYEKSAAKTNFIRFAGTEYPRRSQRYEMSGVKANKSAFAEREYPRRREGKAMPHAQAADSFCRAWAPRRSRRSEKRVIRALLPHVRLSRPIFVRFVLLFGDLLLPLKSCAVNRMR